MSASSGAAGWSNSWTGEGYRPDYNRVRDLLELLLDRGAADSVVELGKELFEAGVSQVERVRDEGETAAEIIACLAIVFRALPQSSKTPAEQILWVIDRELRDEYELCQGLEEFWGREFPQEAWNEVADVLRERVNRLDSQGNSADFSSRYRRDRLTNFLLTALENAGREEEILPLAEREAEKTGAYVRLVELLGDAGRLADAEAWIRRGVEATQKSFPGIAAQLRGILEKIRIRQGDWKQVAAGKAQEFFRDPSLHGLKQLLQAAEKAECREVVEVAALRYLETGSPPQPRVRKTKQGIVPAWPLPPPETSVEAPARYGRHRQPPFYDVLIDLALDNRAPQTALRWYDEAQQHSQPLRGFDERIADAIVGLYPDRAVEFWKKRVEGEIAQVSPSAYERAAAYLRKIRRTLEPLGRVEEFRAYVARLRKEQQRKRRLVEILDSLEGKPIIQA